MGLGSNIYITYILFVISMLLLLLLIMMMMMMIMVMPMLMVMITTMTTMMRKTYMLMPMMVMMIVLVLLCFPDLPGRQAEPFHRRARRGRQLDVARQVRTLRTRAEPHRATGESPHRILKQQQ